MSERLRISSPVFMNGESIPSKYTADGENVSPPLIISGVSADTKSLVLIIDDPDAATDPKGPGKTFDHWVVFNIPPTVTEISEDSVPSGAVQGKNGLGESRYIGPAPPTGTHRYYFRLYSLIDKLNPDQSATKTNIQFALNPLLIDQTELVDIYKRTPSNFS
jgi:Raf kinase inhibitor-like YbhB/YbcL family protein